MALTLYAARKLTDHLFGNVEFVMPEELWLGLHTLSPGAEGSLANEISTSGTGYARLDLTGKMSPADLVRGVSILTETINQGPALADWGTVRFLSVSDAQENGNMLIFGAFSEAQTISAGQTFQRVAEQFQFRMI
jgi:hypothetical protein